MKLLFSGLLGLLVSGTVASAEDGLPLCDEGPEPPSPCFLRWVSHGEPFVIEWEQTAISPSELGQELDFQAGEVLRFPTWLFPPSLIDIDQDGWADLAAIEFLGNVNAGYVVYRFDPGTHRFIQAGLMSGLQFGVHETGLIISISRSSCCSNYMTVYRFSDNKLVSQFSVHIEANQFDVNDLTSAGVAYEEFTCTVGSNSMGFDEAAVSALIPDLWNAFCTYYEGGWETLNDSINDLWISNQ